MLTFQNWNYEFAYMVIKVFTAFSGYDSQCLALDRLVRENSDFSYELVGWSEIDKYAIVAHNALFPQWADRNYGDITQIDWSTVPDFDLFTYSSPCQDFSNAGKQAGGAKARAPGAVCCGNVSALYAQSVRGICCLRT